VTGLIVAFSLINSGPLCLSLPKLIGAVTNGGTQGYGGGTAPYGEFVKGF
jgi:hypothetical protein